MIPATLPARLSQAWSSFMEPLREGRFCAQEGREFLNLLREVEPPGEELPVDVVRWVWLIPFTLHWFGKALPDEVDEDEFRQLEEAFYEEVSRWLGEP